MGATMREEYVGRNDELALLGDAAEEAASGTPRLVVIDGAAGIGKTALLRRFSADLSSWTVLPSHGDETESRVPYGLLARLCSGPVPGFADRVNGDGPITRDPVAVGSEVVQLLGAMQDDGPVAVLVDDLTWSDAPSIRALTFALRRLRNDRVLTIVTVRSNDRAALPEVFIRYCNDHASTLSLHGLTVDETRALAASMGYAHLPRRAVERLRRHTHGSPLLLRALFNELPAAELMRTDGSVPAPSSMSGLVLAEMATCSPSARGLLVAASVLGLRCSLADAAAVADVADSLAALEEAASTSLLDASLGYGRWTMSFTHPLVRSAIYDDVGPARRASLHRRAAAVTQAPDSLNHEALAVGGEPDEALASRLITRAHDAAACGRLLQAAEDLAAASRMTTQPTLRSSLGLEAVELLLDAGEVADAQNLLEQPDSSAPDVRRDVAGARLAMLLGRPEDAATLALNAWQAPDSGAPRAAAAAILSQLAILADAQNTGAAWAERGLLSEPIPPELRAELTYLCGMGHGLAGDRARGLAVFDDLPDDARAVPPTRRAELTARGALRMMTSDLEGARRDLTAALANSLDIFRPRVLAALGMLAETEYRIGAWDDSLLHARLAISLARDTDQIWLGAYVHSAAARVTAARGMWPDASEHVRLCEESASAVGDPASAAYTADARVHLAACRGDTAAVVKAAQPLRSGMYGRTPFEPGVLSWSVTYASALVAESRLDDAARYLDELEKIAHTREHAPTIAGVARVRGELALARRDKDGARSHFESALAESESLASLDWALLRATYGQFLRRIGERRPAGELLRAARGRFTALGAEPFRARCDVELAACGLAVDRVGVPIANLLTPQEHAVAQLIRGGRTNKQAAAELFVSVKTVGYHLGNVYSKLGISSRSQLVALMTTTERAGQADPVYSRDQQSPAAGGITPANRPQ
jgi:ATP/maltotriose-dependent transcriptional regulator MalT